MEHVIRFIVRHGGMLAMLSLTSLIVPAWFVPRAQIDNSLEVWMGRGSDDFLLYQEFRSRYGSDEMIIIAASIPQPLSPPAVAVQREMASALRQIKGIRDVTALPDVHAAIVSRTPESAADPSSHPLIRNLLLSEDRQTVGMVAWLDAVSDRNSRARIVDGVRRAAGILNQHGYAVHIVGAPLLNVELDRASSREALRLMPAAAVLSLGMLLALFRSITVPAICLLATAAAVLWTVTLLVISGTTFNLMSVVLPGLLVVLALAPGTHMAVRYLNHLAMGLPPEVSLRSSIDELLGPVVLTTLTTVIGFASLLVTEMEPVREVGLFAVAGIVLSLVFMLAVVPGLLRWMPMPINAGPGSGRRKHHWTAIGGAMGAARPRLITLLSLILLGTLGFVATGVRTETNVLSFLPADSPVAADYRFVSERLTGLYTLEMDVAVPLADESTARSALCRMSEALGANPHVARVDHYGLFAPLLATDGVLAMLPETLDPVHRAASHFRVVEGQTVHLRASILVRSMASSDFDGVIQAARREADTLLPASAQANLTGAVLLMSQSQAALVRTQVRSFAVAVGAVLLVMGLVMRSWRAMLVAIVPNVLPIVAMFAIMAMLRIALNPATVMIASVAIGLGVDGTIHFLASYRRSIGTDPVSAAQQALEMSGRPIVFTTLVAAAGFSFLILSDFTPLREFGLLTGATLIVAMLCDIFFTPAWAALIRPWENSNAIAVD